MSAATLIAMTGENIGVGIDLPRDSCSLSRKKARNGCSSLPSSAHTKVPSHLTPFKRTASFDYNLDTLCGQFPQVHHGLVSSLLESAANDVVKASCLLQQVSESDTEKTFGRKQKRRIREWTDVCMEDKFLDKEVLNSAAHRPDAYSRSHNAESTLTSVDSTSTVILCPQQCLDDNRSPSSSNLCPVVSDLTATPSESSLKQTIQLLSRVILKQSDKIGILQAEATRQGTENAELRASLQVSTEELKQCRETVQMLQFYLTTNRNHFDFWNNGGGGDTGGFNNAFHNRMPDVF